MTNRIPPTPPIVDDLMLDRLVDGELDDRRRAALLAGLEVEPNGWRRCALAFLEAQAWQRALPRPGVDVRETGINEPGRRAPMRLRAMTRFTGMAAAILLAFAAGFITRSRSGPGAGIAGGDAAPVPPVALAPADAPVIPAGAAPAPAAIPDYVRRQLERQGYEVQGDRKLVSVALKDGRQMTVPVETYKYRFVGQRLH